MIPKFLKFRMWKVSWVFLISFLILAGIDLYSTLRIGDIIQYLETNPVYQYTGSWMLIVLFNFVFIYLILRAYDKFTVMSRFMLCAYMVWFSIIRVMVIFNNLQVKDHIANGVITKETAMAITSSAKYNYLFMTVILPLLVMSTLTLLIFLLFRLDHDVVRKNVG